MSKFAFITKPFVIDLLGIGHLSSILKQNGHEVDIFLPDKDLMKNIREYNPYYLCYSLTTGQHRFYIELNQKIRKEHYAISIFGGPHCTYFPDIYNEDKVDVVFQGEAEETIIDYLSIPHFSSLTHSIIKPEKNPQDLDKFPFPDRKLIYKFNKGLNPIKNIMTSRGCPFNCSYCFNNVYRKMFSGNHVRYRSVDNVIEEAKQLVKDYSATKFIFFEDDCFAFKMEWLREFASKYKAKINIPFHCQIRIEMISDERIKLLKEAGCISVTFAIESGNEEIRRKLLNRNYSNKQIIDGVKILKKYKMEFRSENMIGLPTETIDNMLETIELNKKIKGIYHWVSIFQPYSRTKLGNLCKKMLLYDGRIDNIKRTFFEDTILKTKIRKKIINLQRLFSIFIHFNIPKWLIRLLIKLPNNKFYNYISQAFKQKQYNQLYKW